MIPLQLKMVLIAAIAAFFIIVLMLLKRRRLALKYTLLWLLTGVVMLVLVSFPELLLLIARLSGIQSVMNTLYMMLLAFVLILLMMLTSIVSKQTERIRDLAQSNALLEERLRALEAEKAQSGEGEQ